MRLRSHLIAAAVGGLIARVPLNEVTPVAGPGPLLYRKRRRWYAASLIAGARLFSTRFRTLPDPLWQRWERELYRQLYGEWVGRATNGALLLPARPGRLLAELLPEQAGGPAALQALEAALHTLFKLHRVTIQLPGGARRPFSHADARVENVTYDAATGLAWWFDFETAHDPHRPPAWCHADDLRALLYSAAMHLGVAYVSPLARLVARNYPDPPVLAELRLIAGRLLRRPDPLHFAQVRIGYHLDRLLSTTLLNELS